MITASIKDRPIGAGLIVSIALHIALILAVMFGLPIFWKPDPLPEVIGIQLAQMSDITAAPKPAKVNNQKIVKGTATPTPPDQKQPPKPQTPPPPPVQQTQSAPPPPQPPAPTQPESKPAEPPKEQAEAIPDKTKKPEDKKPDDKKPAEQKKPDKKPADKPKKDTSDQDLNSLLNNVLKDQPAPDTKADQTKKAPPPPQQPAAEGPQTSQFSEIPLTASETDGIAAQVQPNWNIGSLAGAPDFDKMIVVLHVTLLPDGTITNVTVDNTQPGNPYFKQAMESARRAMLITKQLKLPPGKTYQMITFQFRPADFQ